MHIIRSVAIALLAASCCNGANHPGGPAGAKLKGPTATDVKPLAIKAESKKQDQALILGTKDGATAIPLAGRENASTIDVMWVRPPQPGMPAEGGSSPATLVTAPENDDKVRVGVFEEFDGGAGPMMRAAVWMSSFVAATTLGKDLTDYRFAAEYEGYIDGPSAGGLMTVGFLASLTGDTIDATAAMTGTINPDGTIGPVGGIPHKIAGSAKKGKKRLGYPIGQRYDTDMNTGTKVDLEQVAKDNGTTVEEIADVYQAYHFLTGKTLPQPEPLDAKEMAVSDATEQKIAAKYDAWMQQYKAELAALEQAEKDGASKNVPAKLAEYDVDAAREGVEAEKLKGQGLMAAAYYRIVRATIDAATAKSTWGIVIALEKGDLGKAKDLLAHEMTTVNDTEAALKTVGEKIPATITDHLLQISAFQAAIAGLSSQMYGAIWVNDASDYLKALEGKSASDLASAPVITDVVIRVAPAVESLTRGQALAIVANETLEIEAEDGLAYKCSLPNAKRLSMSFGSAAVANLAYFDALEIEPYANAQHITMDKATEQVMRVEPRYLVAKRAFQVPTMMQEGFGWAEDSLPAVLGSMAGSILSYVNSSFIIAEYYSLGVGVKDGEMVVSQDKAFGHMLELADLKAREYAHEAKVAIGQVPVQARVHYQIAQVLREGRTIDQLRSLEEYWKASTYSQVAIMLARN